MMDTAEIVRNYKRDTGCYDCQCDDPDILSFHHLNTMIKNDNISNMVHSGLPLVDIMNEIKNTIVLCHNCHMKWHREEEFNHKVDTSNQQLSYIFEE